MSKKLIILITLVTMWLTPLALAFTASPAAVVATAFVLLIPTLLLPLYLEVLED